MLGKKSKEIEQLQGELNQLRDTPYILLAQQIEADITSMTIDSSESIDEIMKKAIGNAERSAYLTLLTKRLDALDPITLLETFQSHIGNEDVKELLERRAMREYERYRDTQLVNELRTEALLSRQVDLSKLPLGSVVTIGVFDPEEDDEDKCFNCKEDSIREFTGRVDNVDAANKMTIISDIRDDWYEKVKGIPKSFQDHTIVEFGSLVRDGSNKTMVPTVSHGTYPALRFDGGEPCVLTYDVGYVVVNGDVVLDYKY